MNKVIGSLVLVAGLMLAGGMAGAATAEAPVVNQDVKAVEAGNKICPVMGSAVSDKISVEYKGKIYHFCCPMCVSTFNSDPEKYSKIADDEAAADKAK